MYPSAYQTLPTVFLVSGGLFELYSFQLHYVAILNSHLTHGE